VKDVSLFAKLTIPNIGVDVQELAGRVDQGRIVPVFDDLNNPIARFEFVGHLGPVRPRKASLL
jgi:hypothetical protein